MTTDFITVLTHSTTPLSKRWCADGSIQAFGHAKHFSAREIPVSSFGEMAATLSALHGKPRSCVIRGRFTGQDLTNTVRQKDVFADTEHHWLLIDVDKYQPLEADPVLEPVESIEQYIHEHLPQEFHETSYHWQLSNSAGHPTKQGLRAHLWFWSETPHTSATLKAWADGLAVDRSLFDEIQIHYTAAPVFDEGVADPVPARSGTVRKASDVVQLTATPAAPNDRTSRQQVAREALSTDPVAQLLYEKGLVKSERRNDMGLNIECPCSDRHTSESGESSTIYYPANTGGYAQRAFKCLHAGCTGSPQSDFLEALGYEEPSIADDFDDVSDEADEPATSTNPYTPVKASLFTKTKPLAYLIKGILPEADDHPTLAMMYGGSGDGKSFMATDMACAIAMGAEWRGRKVKKGRVVYVCAEGAGGYRKRLVAYCQHHGIDIEDLDVWVVHVAPDLLKKDKVKQLIKALEPLSPIALVVVDTLARSTPGADENSAKEMGEAVAACTQISLALHATVLIIHHSGKDDTKGARGSSAIRAAVDTELAVTREPNKNVRGLTVTKQKDGEDGEEMGFSLEIVTIGLDDEGDPITSCVVEHSSATPKKGKTKAPSKHQKSVLEEVEAITDLTEEGADTETVIANVAKRQGVRPSVVRRTVREMLKSCALVEENGRLQVA